MQPTRGSIQRRMLLVMGSAIILASGLVLGMQGYFVRPHSEPKVVAIPSDGVIEEVMFLKGVRVNEGDLLALVSTDKWKQSADLPPLIAQLEQEQTVSKELRLAQQKPLEDARRQLNRAAHKVATLSKAKRKSKAVKARLRKANEVYGEAKVQLSALEKRQRKELDEQDQKLAALREQIEKVKIAHGRVEIRAPASGTLLSDMIAVGKPVRPNQVLVTISAQ